MRYNRKGSDQKLGETDMSTNNEIFTDGDEIEDPIDTVQSLAEYKAWEFDRIAEDQIALAVAGQWQVYQIMISCMSHNATLRLLCVYDVSPDQETLPAFYEILNLINNECWFGSFVFWGESNMLVWRSAVDLPEYACLDSTQVELMIGRMIAICERFYPCFQLVIWGGYAPKKAMEMSMNEAYGRA